MVGMHFSKLLDETFSVFVSGELVILKAEGAAPISLTPDAALMASERLLAAGLEARAHRPAPRTKTN